MKHTATRGQRFGCAVLVVFLAALATLVGPAAPASAAPDLCTTGEWTNPANFQKCIGGLKDLAREQLNCVQAPTPQPPDAGLGGFFASKPESYDKPGYSAGRYSDYGYAGYNFTTYDIGCVKTTMHPDYKFENTVANGEFMVASGILGAANALREKAWDPSSLWGWSDTLVEKATRTLYDRVFTVFGAVTLAIVGLYLLWRSRQANMSQLVTMVGWAAFVMILVTTVAHWPTWSANAADRALVGSISGIHEGLSATGKQHVFCLDSDPKACADNRTAAQAVSDTVTDGLLFSNWERGTLGSADSDTAKKYGYALYESKVFSWGEARDAAHDQALRKSLIESKQKSWNKVAAQVKDEDPAAYENLQGLNSMDRIGAGFIAMLAAIVFSVFDLAASILVLLGFGVFRFIVIVTPILGTIALFRPARGALVTAFNLIMGSVLNILIFGAGAGVYVLAVNIILNTALAGWVQLFLIFLVGAVGWLALRPYRRMRFLGNRDPVRFTGNATLQGAHLGHQIDRAVTDALKRAGR